jgi:hypothetical protein
MVFMKSKRYKNLSQSWHVKLVLDHCCQLEKNSYVVMFVDCFQHLKSGLACKNKWTSILGELKKIDYIYNIIHKLQQGLLVNINKTPPPFPTVFTT